MCGIAGFVDSNTEYSEAILNNMARAIYYRGPDNQSVYISSDKYVNLAHRRLSILDLSREGDQPFRSYTGKSLIVYNGEIYNYKQLRDELKTLGITCKTNTDTEVLVNAIEFWGIEKALSKAYGMFALAYYDLKEKKITLARDRAGEKPIYYSINGNSLIFGSELKSLIEHPRFKKKVSVDALGEFLKFSYVPCPYSIYEGAYKLEPGTFITFDVNDILSGKISENFEPFSNSEKLVRPIHYWSLENIVAKNSSKRSAPVNYSILKRELKNTIKDIIREMMVSDVPLGAFLSGGIDSSLIVSVMQEQSEQKVKTFSIGFAEESYNEAHYAKEVAAYLGVDHEELYVSKENILDAINKMSYVYDEPFADSSQWPTYIVSGLAKQKVTVCLSGDGGDEVFGGYNRYIYAAKIWNKINKVPFFIRFGISKLLSLLSAENWTRCIKYFKLLLPKLITLDSPGDKIYKFKAIIGSKNFQEMYWSLLSATDETSFLIKGELKSNINQQWRGESTLSGVRSLMYMDFLHYLEGDILAKVDRAAMSHSLETRVPFLDGRVVDLAWSLPDQLLVSGNEGKKILREILYDYVPKNMVDRPKKGFGIPLGDWLRVELCDWAEELLSPELIEKAFLDRKYVEKVWLDHKSKKKSSSRLIWNILMYLSWYKRYMLS